MHESQSFWIRLGERKAFLVVAWRDKFQYTPQNPLFAYLIMTTVSAFVDVNHFLFKKIIVKLILLFI